MLLNGGAGPVGGGYVQPTAGFPPVGQAAGADLSQPIPPEAVQALKVTGAAAVAALALAIIFPYPVTKLIVAALLGTTILGCVRKVPEVALAVLVVFLPVVYLLPSLPIPGANGQTAVALLAVYGTLVLLRRRPGALPYAPMIWGLVAVGVLGSAQTIFLYAAPAGLVFTDTKNWLGYFPLFFFAAAASRAPWARRLLAVSILVSAGLVATHSTYVTILKGTSIRVAGLVGHQPNVYAGYLAFILPVAISFAVNGRGRWILRLLSAGVAGLMATTLIFTASRGAWVALAGGILGMIVLRRNVKLGILIVLLVLSAGQILPDLFFERLDRTVAEPIEPGEKIVLDGSTELRVKMWKAFPALLMERPFIGHGLWTYGHIVWKRGIHFKPKSAHSSIIQFGVETGLVGLGLYLLFMARLILQSLRFSSLAMTPFDQRLYTGTMGGFIALLLSDVSGSRFFSSGIFAVFCLVAGLVSGRIAGAPPPAGGYRGPNSESHNRPAVPPFRSPPAGA